MAITMSHLGILPPYRLTLLHLLGGGGGSYHCYLPFQSVKHVPFSGPLLLPAEYSFPTQSETDEYVNLLSFFNRVGHTFVQIVVHSMTQMICTRLLVSMKLTML